MKALFCVRVCGVFLVLFLFKQENHTGKLQLTMLLNVLGTNYFTGFAIVPGVQWWKDTPDLGLGQKGTHDFTIFSGLSVLVSRYLTTSFWSIKALLRDRKVDSEG